MRRVRAIKGLKTDIRQDSVQRDSTDHNSEGDEEGYTSLDGESYLDYDSQSDLSDNGELHQQESSRGSTARQDLLPLMAGGLGYTQQTDLFIVGQRQMMNSDISSK